MWSHSEARLKMRIERVLATRSWADIDGIVAHPIRDRSCKLHGLADVQVERPWIRWPDNPIIP